VNAIHKPLSGVKNLNQKPHEALKGFRYQIYRDSRKTWCRDVAQFCHPSETKRNTNLKKHSCKAMHAYSAVSRGRLMQ
jgi:hypothetical protein